MAVIKQTPRYRYTNNYNPEFVTHSADNMGMRVKVPEAELLTGDKKGELVTELKPNQLAKLSSPVGPRKYNAMAGYNPLLAELADVSMSPVLEDGQSLSLVIKARKAFNLEDLDYVFSMWVVE